MPKCRICHEELALWAWQPFGPGKPREGFTLLGNHYRGFPVIKICESCKKSYQAGNAKVFTFKHDLYRIIKNVIEKYNGENYETLPR